VESAGRKRKFRDWGLDSARLTPAGKALAKDARRLIEGAVAMRARAAASPQTSSPSLSSPFDGYFSPRAADRESQGAAECVSAHAGVDLHRDPRRLRAASARRRRAFRHLSAGDDRRGRSDARLSRLNRRRSRGQRRSSALSGARPIARETLEPHVQLVLTDRILLTQDLRGGIVSHHIWRFADLSTRLEFLLAGFGWCNMPLHMVRGPIEQGRLKALKARGARRVPVPRPYRACARARDRPRRALAHRDLRVRMAGG
jgi:DNA-binding transcriptional LysR family regulator